jgi:hypothetical protein
MSIAQKAQQIAESVPAWANWTLIAGPWLIAILQPAALIVTIVWGTLQVYGWFEARRQKRKEGK